jgi:hypothetical protein
MPSTVGSGISVSTTSGRRRSAAIIAGRPSPASPETLISGSFSRIARMPARTSTWLSQTRTRIPVSGSGRGERAAGRLPPSTSEERTAESADSIATKAGTANSSSTQIRTSAFGRLALCYPLCQLPVWLPCMSRKVWYLRYSPAAPLRVSGAPRPSRRRSPARPSPPRRRACQATQSRATLAQRGGADAAAPSPRGARSRSTGTIRFTLPGRRLITNTWSLRNTAS